MNGLRKLGERTISKVLGGGWSGREPSWTILLLATACSLVSRAEASPQTEPKQVGHVTVQVFADRQAVVPGQAVEFAVSVKPDKDWYVYWQNPGAEVGLPTTFDWTVPAGYQVGRTRYPIPHVKYEKVLKATSFVHDEASLFLTPVRAPETAKPGEEAAFKVKVSWLVCSKGQCVPGDVEVSLKLPVVEKGTTAKPANEKVFDQARAALPLPLKEAKHVKIRGSIDKEAVKPGDKFTATLTAELEAKHHMQSHKPAQEGLIPAVVFVELTDGLDINAGKYPKGEEREDKVLGKLSEYSGKVQFRIPVEVDKEAGKSPRWIRGIFQYQICSDSGTCFPPQHIEFTIPVRMEGGPEPKPGAVEQPESPAAQPSTAESPPTAEKLETKPKETPPVASAPSVEGPKPAEPAKPQPPKPASSETPSAESGKSLFIRIQDYFVGLGFGGVIVLAFFGGMILNLMPCVLPVISLKVLSFVRQAHEDRWRVFRLGLTYSAGIMVFYLVLAALLYTAGKNWGELFQEPRFVIIMAAIVLALALSLFGVFALFAPHIVNELGQRAEAQEGYVSAFSTGILATLLGTACTAPFLSLAISYATRLPAAQGVWIFVVAGFGMAFPFIVLTYNPAWLRFVPRPGPWLGTFEHIMGFLLLGTVVWLLNPLRDQIGAKGLLLTLIFLLAVATAAWLKGKIGFDAPPARKANWYAIALAVLLVGWLVPFYALATIGELKAAQQKQHELLAVGQNCLAMHGGGAGGQVVWNGWAEAKPGEIPWQSYINRQQAERYVNAGYTVFVDYTASWCASCKTNLVTSIENRDVVKLMRELNVVPFEADYSLRDPEIKKDLDRFHSAGVPLYLVYRPGDPNKPEKLPELLTPGTVLDALRRAGPSKPMAAPAPPAGDNAPAPPARPANQAPASDGH